jgi:phospholipid/cholesterol/gamma-HCH transport system ATP-binding protein
MIRFEKVVKDLAGKRVLDGVNLEIEEGETFVIIGTSGAGKSVTLKHMIRLLTPDEGRVRIGDDCISEAKGADLERIRGRFGMLFQSAALLQWMNVLYNVGLPLRIHTDLSDEEIEEKVYQTLDLVNLREAAEKFPADLSGGMQKRVGLARAIIRRPEIVLYDEPTSGLDPVTSRKIDDLINDLRERMGITGVVVTHDLHSALSIASRIGMIHGGKMIEVASPEDFIRSEHEVVKDFLDAQFITRKGRWEKGGRQ